MVEWMQLAAVIIAAAVFTGLVAILRPGHFSERLLAVQLIGSGGVALLLLLAFLLAAPALIDVALVLALLAPVTVAAFTRRELETDHD